MPKSLAIEIVQKFWQLMASNNFDSVRETLAEDFILDWPQSNERIHGIDKFIAMNKEYPAHGPWIFTINKVVGNDSEAVSDVNITDGVIQARAITFFTITNSKITHIVEFWPESYPAPKNRQHLTKPISNI